MERIEYVDRKSGEKVVESVMGDGALKFAYETLLGRTLWPVLFGSKLISSILGRRYDSPRSKKDIAALANIPGCQPEEAEKPMDDYASFNAFFTRRLKPGARPVGAGLVSPADGRLMLYLNADADTPFPLKGATRSLRTVFDREAPAGRYDIAVIRLAPVDYHRFHFPCDCTTPDPVRIIPGKYHSVNPIALVRYPDVYADNERQIVKCQATFGDFWLVDVGAFGVGTIVQTYSGTTHAKGDEKGYFKFGGSTVILILSAGKVAFDADLVANSASGLETRVRCAEQIARFPSEASSEQKRSWAKHHFLEGVPEGRREELMKTLKAMWTHDSTALEGNTLTLGDTIFVLQYGLTVKGKPLKDHDDVMAHAKGVDFICGLVDCGKVTSEDVRELHRRVVVREVCDIYKPVGDWKREDNGTYNEESGRPVYMPYASAEDTPTLMERWAKAFNALFSANLTEAEALDAYLRAHVSFVRIHPFFDGNGRLARLLANLPVMFAGYPPIVVPTEARSEYIRALWDYQRSVGTISAEHPELLPHPERLEKLRGFMADWWRATLDLVAEARTSVASVGCAK